LKKINHRMVGWSWMLWDWNWYRVRTADSVLNRVRGRIGNGDIVVMHDGDEKAPFDDQRHTVEAIARLIPELRAKGFAFGTICDGREPLWAADTPSWCSRSSRASLRRSRRDKRRSGRRLSGRARWRPKASRRWSSDSPDTPRFSARPSSSPAATRQRHSGT